MRLKKPSFSSLFSLSTSTLALALAAAAFGSACVETEEVAPQVKGFTPDANAVYQLIGVQSGRCVEVTDGEPHAMQIRTCATSPRHRFKIEAAGGGFYKLHNVETNLCMDIDGQSRADAARLM